MSDDRRLDIRSPAEKALAAVLAAYLGTKRGADLIAEAVIEVIRDEIREHAESEPHIYADGSRT